MDTGLLFKRTLRDIQGHFSRCNIRYHLISFKPKMKRFREKQVEKMIKKKQRIKKNLQDIKTQKHEKILFIYLYFKLLY